MNLPDAISECQTIDALVRWQHPELELVMPDEFIPMAERNGLICALTDMVTHEINGAIRWYDYGRSRSPRASMIAAASSSFWKGFLSRRTPLANNSSAPSWFSG